MQFILLCSENNKDNSGKLDWSECGAHTGTQTFLPEGVMKLCKRPLVPLPPQKNKIHVKEKLNS